MNARRSTCAIVVAAGWLWLGVAVSRAAPYLVHFDQDLYVVNAPGDTFVARILIDADSATPRDEPVPNGLFSFGVRSTFDSAKAQVASPAEVDPVPPLDFFGFGPGAFEQVAAGLAGVKGNIDQFGNPLQPYGGTLLAEVTFTNLASAVDNYPLDLDFFRTVGPNEQLFLDGQGIVLDPGVMFRGARVLVVPEPQSGLLAIVAIGSLAVGFRRARGWRRARRPEPLNTDRSAA